MSERQFVKIGTFWSSTGCLWWRDTGSSCSGTAGMVSSELPAVMEVFYVEGHITPIALSRVERLPSARLGRSRKVRCLRGHTVSARCILRFGNTRSVWRARDTS